MFFALSFLPALASGVMPLRLVEFAFLLYAGCFLLVALLLRRLILVALARIESVQPRYGLAVICKPPSRKVQMFSSTVAQ
jgi:hypothetical protein